MPLTEAKPRNVFATARWLSISLRDVEFLAARHPGARNWGWGRVRPGVSATLLPKQIHRKTSWGRLD